MNFNFGSDIYRGRLNNQEQEFVPEFERNNPGYVVNDYNS